MLQINVLCGSHIGGGFVELNRYTVTGAYCGIDDSDVFYYAYGVPTLAMAVAEAIFIARTGSRSNVSVQILVLFASIFALGAGECKVLYI